MATNVDDNVDEANKDAAVHDWVRETVEVIEAGDPKAIKRAIFEVLGLRRVRFWKAKNPEKQFKLKEVVLRNELQTSDFNRVGSLNDHDRTYSAMEQGDLMRLLWGAFVATKEGWYRRTCFAAGDVLLDDYDDGGLRLGKGWFAAQTAMDQRDIGRTLNKHLSATRSLWNIGEESGNGDYKNAAVKALKATVKNPGLAAGDYIPSIYDYVPRTTAGAIIPNSWLYYGVTGLTKNSRPYFLSSNLWKNAQYHTYCMRLIYYMVNEMGPLFPMSDWQSTNELDGQTILKRMGDAYRTKARLGLYIEHTAPKPGNFSAFLKETIIPPTAPMLALFS